MMWSMRIGGYVPRRRSAAVGKAAATPGQRRPGAGGGTVEIVGGRPPRAQQRAGERPMQERMETEIEHADLDAGMARGEFGQQRAEHPPEPRLLVHQQSRQPPRA